MRLVQIYQCLCDETRLRILNLLTRGPLCVCHVQAILKEPQVKVSKHLAYLRQRGLVGSYRHKNWMVYHLPEERTPELIAHLKCLQDCVLEDPQFKRDLRARDALDKEIQSVAQCKEAVQPPHGTRS